MEIQVTFKWRENLYQGYVNEKGNGSIYASVPRTSPEVAGSRKNQTDSLAVLGWQAVAVGDEQYTLGQVKRVGEGAH